MGWTRTLLLGDVGNRLDIADTERDIERLQQALREADAKNLLQNEHQNTRLHRLERENAELKLCLAALMRLLASKGTLDLRELQAIADVIDAEDGKRDGQLRSPVGSGLNPAA